MIAERLLFLSLGIMAGVLISTIYERRYAIALDFEILRAIRTQHPAGLSRSGRIVQTLLGGYRKD